jgi:hypothetical protein
MINYKASGNLLSSAKSTKSYEKNVHLILVEKAESGPGSHVVATYNEGSSEWYFGHYFDSHAEAHAYFVSELLNELPLQHVEVHPQIVPMVEKLGKILKALAKSA